MDIKDESSAVKDGNIITDFKDITVTFSGSTKDGGNYAPQIGLFRCMA